jgi:hypothetical protein
MVTPSGNVSVVVDSLPSSETSMALGNLVSGVSSVAFVGHHLYGLEAGAGCSHGVQHVPNGVFRVGPGDSWTMIADLSAFQAANPVAQPDDGDFEPDGTWYSMSSFHGALYPMDSNHGELDRVTQSGSISRVVDISAQLGHVVPTAIIRNQGHWLIGNLGLFGTEDGTTPNENVYKISHSGHISVLNTGLEQVVGLGTRGHDLYALELSNTPGGPTPGTGQIVRLRHNHAPEVVFSGLTFPTGMAVGRDGAFYVSENGLGFPAGAGQVVRIKIHDHHGDDHHHH